MRGSNFISFLMVQGFFIGIIFGILKSESAWDFLVLVISVTAVFYLFAHVCVGFYFQTMGIQSHPFPKQSHERSLDLFVREINKREQFIDAFYYHKEELLDEGDRGRG